MLKQIGIFITGLMIHQSCFAASLSYSSLQIKNLDEMRETLRQYVVDAEAHIEEDETAEATGKLREAFKTILSRPNGDNMVSQLMPMIKARIRDLNAYEDTLIGLADEAIYALTQGKEKPSLKSTNLIVLENILSEFRPEVENNKEIRKVFEKIRDAKIKIPSAVKNDLRLRGMYKSKGSPSKVAEKIIGKPPKEK